MGVVVKFRGYHIAFEEFKMHLFNEKNQLLKSFDIYDVSPSVIVWMLKAWLIGHGVSDIDVSELAKLISDALSQGADADTVSNNFQKKNLGSIELGIKIIDNVVTNIIEEGKNLALQETKPVKERFAVPQVTWMRKISIISLIGYSFLERLLTRLSKQGISLDHGEMTLGRWGKRKYIKFSEGFALSLNFLYPIYDEGMKLALLLTDLAIFIIRREKDLYFVQRVMKDASIKKAQKVLIQFGDFTSKLLEETKTNVIHFSTVLNEEDLIYDLAETLVTYGYATYNVLKRKSMLELASEAQQASARRERKVIEYIVPSTNKASGSIFARVKVLLSSIAGKLFSR